MELERIELSQRERDRLRLLHEVKNGHLTQAQAATRLSTVDGHRRSPVNKPPR